MAEAKTPDDGDYLADFRVGVDFTVGASDMAETRLMMAFALDKEDEVGLTFIDHFHDIPDQGRSWGPSGWELAPARPSQAALVQERYPGLVNDAAVIDVLEAITRAEDRSFVPAEVLSQDTRDRVRQMLAGLDPAVRVEDPDRHDRLIYEGPASGAAHYLTEGAYRAFDRNDREHALLVAPSELTPSGRVSRAIPKDRHDMRTLDEIAALLREHTSEQPLPDLVRHISRRLETTRREGLPSWMPLGGEPAAVEPAEHVNVGVIVWSEMAEDEPTVLADQHPVGLARVLAENLHASLRDSDVFAGAAEFLDRHQPPSAWETPEDVDAWLEDLRAATDYPSFSIQRLPIGTSSPAGEPSAAEATRTPVGQEPLFTYRMPVTFEVSARTDEEARELLDEALTGDAAPATPEPVQRGQHVRADGDVHGVLGWHHDDQELRTHRPDLVREVLRERGCDLDLGPGERGSTRPGGGPDRGRDGLG